MRLKWLTVIGIVLLVAQASAAAALVLETDEDKQSYAVGVDMARNLKRQGIVTDPEALAQGILDELSGAKVLMTEDELRLAINAFQTEMKRKRARTLGDVAEANRKEGEAFLTENKTREGVVALPSGLQYKILEEGSGKKPTDDDLVEVNFRGMLINGAEFDNSYRRGQPAIFRLTGALPGWTEALRLMPVGSKWQIYLPPQLAYGEQGSGRKVSPNSTIIFDLELVAIK